MQTESNPLPRAGLWRKVAIGLVILAVLALAWVGPLDEFAKKNVGTALNRALVTFATARSANAVISVVKSTTVSVPLIGGVTTSPGELLEPLDELIQEFSAVMLAASMSLAAQRLLISLGALVWLTGALTIVLVAWGALRIMTRPSPLWLARLIGILIFIRFAVPVAALASEGAYWAVMSTPYETAQAEVDSTSTGMLDRLRNLKNSPELLRHPGDSWNDFKTKIESQVHHVVTLMAIFVLQTIVLPLVFIWAGYKTLGAAITWRQALHWPRAAA